MPPPLGARWVEAERRGSCVGGFGESGEKLCGLRTTRDPPAHGVLETGGRICGLLLSWWAYGPGPIVKRWPSSPADQRTDDDNWGSC